MCNVSLLGPVNTPLEVHVSYPPIDIKTGTFHATMQRACQYKVCKYRANMGVLKDKETGTMQLPCQGTVGRHHARTMPDTGSK